MGRIRGREILILNWRDIKHPYGGGAELSLFEHAKNLNLKGAKVTWFASDFKGAKKYEVIDGITFLRHGSQYTVHVYAALFYIGGALGHPDVVIDSFHGIPFFTPLYLRKAKIIALINEVADSIWFLNTFLPLAVVGYLLEQFSYPLYKKTHFITASDSTLKALVKKNISKKKIYIVPHGVTLPKIKKHFSKEKKPTIIFLSRVSEDKGIRDAIEAFNIVLDSIDADFWVVGKEDRKGALTNVKNAIIKDKNKLQRIKYFGFVAEDKKFELLSRAWILVHPSIKEGWGLNVIEAAAQMTPTVGYDVEGLRDSIINGKTGILSTPNSLSLAECINGILQDNEKRMTMGQKAKKWSENFTWSKSTQKSLEVIEKII